MKVSITISLPLELLNKLSDEVVKTGMSRSTIVVKGIKMYFEDKYGKDEEEL